MDVNVTGPLRCTQAFLPLLREGPRRGRVVNMSSIVRTPLVPGGGGGRDRGGELNVPTGQGEGTPPTSLYPAAGVDAGRDCARVLHHPPLPSPPRPGA